MYLKGLVTCWKYVSNCNGTNKLFSSRIQLQCSIFGLLIRYLEDLFLTFIISLEKRLGQGKVRLDHLVVPELGNAQNSKG